MDPGVGTAIFFMSWDFRPKIEWYVGNGLLQSWISLSVGLYTSNGAITMTNCQNEILNDRKVT
jgi:hypothetical protein